MQRLLLFLGSLAVLLVTSVSCSSSATPADAPAVPATSGDVAAAPNAERGTPDAVAGRVPTGVAIPSTYSTFCSSCHGAQGEGSTAAPAFDAAALQAMDTAELIQIISEGVAGTAMIGWNRVLSRAQIEELALFLQQLERAEPVATVSGWVAPDPSDPQSMLRAGAQVYAGACASCHGDNGSGGYGPVINSQQFLSRHDDARIRDAIINGGWRPMSQMPAFGSNLSAIELDALMAYIRAWQPDAPVVADPRGTAMTAAGAGQGHGLGAGQGMGGSSAGKPTAVYSGTVAGMQGNQLLVAMADGTQLAVMVGPRWYWNQAGIVLQPGDRVMFEAFEERTGQLALNWLEHPASGARYVLHNEDGSPAFQ